MTHRPVSSSGVDACTFFENIQNLKLFGYPKSRITRKLKEKFEFIVLVINEKNFYHFLSIPLMNFLK